MDPITLSILSKALPYAPGLISGGVRTASSYGKLKKLENQPLPKFDTTQAQQNIDMYQRRFRQGLSPEERAAMGQQFQSEQAGMYRQTSERAGGQISNFLGRVTAMDRVRNAMRTGTMMAQERRAAMSGLAGARQGLQSQLNAQTQMDMSRRMAEEQSLGQGMRGGLNTLEKSAMYGLYGGLGAASDAAGNTDSTSFTPSPTAAPMFSSPGPGQLQTMPDPIINNRFNTRPVQYPGTFSPVGLDEAMMYDASSTAPLYSEDFVLPK
jgi:hypothetical protein